MFIIFSDILYVNNNIKLFFNIDEIFEKFLLLSGCEFLAGSQLLPHGTRFSCFFVAFHYLHPGFSTIDYPTHMKYLNILLLSSFEFHHKLTAPPQKKSPTHRLCLRMGLNISIQYNSITTLLLTDYPQHQK